MLAFVLKFTVRSAISSEKMLIGRLCSLGVCACRLLKGHQVASRVGFMQALVEAQAAIALHAQLGHLAEASHGPSREALRSQAAAFSALCSEFPLEVSHAQPTAG